MGLVAPESVQRLDVDRVESLADPEHEDPEHDERDQDREGDRQLDHERHAFRTRRCQDQAVLEVAY